MAPRKPPELRQRRGRPPAPPIDLGPGGSVDDRPALPARDPGSPAWHPRTVAWWSSVWSSPMARRYLDADVHGLLMAAELVDLFWRAPSARLASELRKQLESHGLSASARKRLDWRVRDDDPAADAPASGNSARARRTDPREAAFRIVDGGLAEPRKP